MKPAPAPHALASSAFNAAAGKRLLSLGRERLHARFRKDNNSAALLHDLSTLVDQVLQQAWRDTHLPTALSLLAVGGYGRGELYPGSDIDLLVLLPDSGDDQNTPDEATQRALERWVSLLWDMGLEAAHSVRTVDECLSEAAKDITVQTSLLEARQLAGDAALFDQFSRAMRRALDPLAFFTAKQLEQKQRHSRFLDTTYNLEPNIKESPGGLRDLQTILWIARAANLGKSWRELANAGLITAREARLTTRHEGVLRDLRVRLHYLAKRREDRLLFDHQTPLAQELGIADRPPRRASELLMQRYYLATKAVSTINTLLLLTLREKIFPPNNEPPIRLNARFQKRGDLLEAIDPDIFEREPSAILESFLLLQQHPDLTRRSASTLRALIRAAPKIDATFRNSPTNQNLFMQMLREPRGLTHELRRMNRHGILGRYIPAFGRIVGQMQHDLFHVYTVDEHILMVVRNLRRFMATEFAHEYPLCTRLINEFERREVLYLAGLFHDIAKGRGGDHSQLGKSDARRFCKLHGVSAEDTELVAWLVENHLVMSATAQKQDISDPHVVEKFARRAGNERYLNALYLLTVADIRGTSPKVWNAWKAKLLENLYWATRNLLGADIAPSLDHAPIGMLQARKNAALELLQRHAPDAATQAAQMRFFEQLDTPYLLRHDAEEIAWHLRHLSQHVDTSTPIVKARIAPAGEGLQVFIYTPDQAELFARICGFFERVQYNIVEAKIFTTAQGYALDSFVVMDPANLVAHYRDVMSYIEYELSETLRLQKPLQPAQTGRLSRHLKHFPITPEVTLEADEQGRYHVLSVVAGDRPGLLSVIAQVLVKHGVNVHNARINTLGERAEDTFVVAGKVLNEPKGMLRLETELLKVLEV